jgi:hypothetical protein
MKSSGLHKIYSDLGAQSDVTRSQANDAELSQDVSQPRRRCCKCPKGQTCMRKGLIGLGIVIFLVAYGYLLISILRMSQNKVYVRKEGVKTVTLQGRTEYSNCLEPV